MPDDTSSIINLPDHSIRQHKLYQMFVRLSRPAHDSRFLKEFPILMTRRRDSSSLLLLKFSELKTSEKQPSSEILLKRLDGLNRKLLKLLRPRERPNLRNIIRRKSLEIKLEQSLLTEMK
jgi:hypothetical protein